MMREILKGKYQSDPCSLRRGIQEFYLPDVTPGGVMSGKQPDNPQCFTQIAKAASAIAG
ncbi:MAG: hypothetical protein AAGH78_11010 [Cyanobacteria bacterium P01_H01_bin.58]